MAVLSAQDRTKLWISTYWSGTLVTKDDNSTPATTILTFDWPDYPLTRVFVDKAVNGIISIGQASSKAVNDSDHFPVGYDEQVPITMAAVDALGVTGIKLLEKMEAQLRTVAEAHPLGSLRRITGTVPKTQRIGSFFLRSIEYELNYRRDIT
jgi:hypothetical protein